MFDPNKINAIVSNLMEALPPGLTQLPKDVEKNFKDVLQSAFTKMDLVTREEFDAQTKVLLRTRQKLEALEKKLDELAEKR